MQHGENSGSNSKSSNSKEPPPSETTFLQTIIRETSTFDLLSLFSVATRSKHAHTCRKKHVLAAQLPACVAPKQHQGKQSSTTRAGTTIEKHIQQR